MATLHMLAHSPFTDGRFDSCLRVLGDKDGLLLSGDAVYALSPNSGPLQHLQALTASIRIYVLGEDVTARGLSVPEQVSVVDYAGFVALCIEFDRVNSWL